MKLEKEDDVESGMCGLIDLLVNEDMSVVTSRQQLTELVKSVLHICTIPCPAQLVSSWFTESLLTANVMLDSSKFLMVKLNLCWNPLNLCWSSLNLC